ncbi:hypothetical protein D5F01_LYC17272 [Larimichthys crocea]|uniref:C2H2-type domain-containing protein n=1 Tax=Larimichthys crocea TaxID=215358 RepID=A0A6G0HXL7_LARCR|nr:hypothetical protein D5F01_LYC17272 [Larimichthys crocea]
MKGKTAGSDEGAIREISPEQQRAAVHKRLSLVAEEIFRILEIMMAEYEAEVSGSHSEIGRHRPLLDITLKTETSLHTTDKPPLQETSNLEDTSTETDSEFLYVKASHLHQTQGAEKGTSAVTEPGGEPQSDPEVLSSNNSEAGSDDSESDEELSEKSDKRKTSQRQSHGADRCITCGTSFRKGKKVKKHTRKTAPTNRSQTAGQSCCRVCGKFFRYKRSFLKHVLQHEQSSDLCGACGKHLDSGESLKEHLQTHNEENICRDQTEAECSDAESKVGDSDEDWKGSGGSESDDRDSEKDETKGGPCSQKPKIQGPNKPKGSKNKDCKDLSHLKYCCKVCGKSFCYRASFLKHVQEDERDADLCGVCGKHFESEESLRLHLQTYIQTNDCEVCGKHFDGHNQLEMHMRTHRGRSRTSAASAGKRSLKTET